MPAEEANGAVAAPGSVLVYSHSWLPNQFDGVAVRIMAHVKALVQRGVKVTVVTPDFVLPDEPAEQKPFVAIPGVEHFTLQTQRTPVYRKNLCMRTSLANFITLVSLIRRIRPDLVHGTQEASMQVLATACLVCDVPLVVSMHTDVIQIAARDDHFSVFSGLLGRLHIAISVELVKWGYKNWAVAGANFFCVSPQARAMLRAAGVRETRVLPGAWGPMVDRDTFRIDLPEDAVAEARQRLTFGIPDAYLLVYVGRITGEKDVQFLVDAMARAPANAVLALVGNGSLVPELKKLHGKEHRLYCTGEFVGREQVAHSLRAADCCVSASTMETIGFTAMEALSCGTPFLAANAQGFADHLSHGVNARLWTPQDTESFDRELKELMATKREGSWTKEALRESMASASVEACTGRVLAAYTYAEHANKRALRLFLSLFLLFLNWCFTFFVK